MNKRNSSRILLFCLIVLSFLANFAPLTAQSFCGTPAISSNMGYNATLNSSSSFGPYKIKIYIHVIRKTDGSEGQTPNSVAEAVSILQKDFNPHDIFFVWDGCIDFMDNTTWYDNPGAGIFNQNNHYDGIDIYLYDDHHFQYAPQANGYGNSSELLIVGHHDGGSDGPEIPYVTTSVISHEMGHVLFLWHTHHGTSEPGSCKELVDGSNGWTCGDFIPDTPADPNIEGFVNKEDCTYFGTYKDDNQDLYVPDEHLIMSYTHPDCMDYFSDGQGQRMRQSISALPFLQATLVDNQGHCGCSFGNHDVLEDITWTYSNAPNGGVNLGDVHVRDGATLTIDANISFASGKKLFIHPGSKVILNRTLTSCNKWGGVRVHGNDEFGAGEFKSNEGAVIENAIWGISTTDGGEYLGRGKVDCFRTHFKNNSTAALIGTKNGYELNREPYDASFENCWFINDNDNRNSKFWVFIASYNIMGSVENPSGVLIDDCYFVDRQTNSTYSTNWNSGVSSLNGDVEIKNCNFQNLYTGVKCHETFGDNPLLIVESSNFQDCGYGVINNGASSSVIANNDFHLGRPFVQPSTYDQVGVILQGLMNDTYMQGNKFIYDDIGENSLLPTKGIYVNNIGEADNRIRKNEFTNLTYANLARGDNANLLNGLHYLCNENTFNVGLDFLSFQGNAIRDEQGLAGLQGVFLPAGNTFSHTQFGLDFGNSGINAANYYYSNSITDQVPISYYGLQIVPGDDVGHCVIVEEPSNLTSPEDINLNEQQYQSYLSEYQQAKQAYMNAENQEDSELTTSTKARLIYEAEKLHRVVGLGYRYSQYTLRDRAATRTWMSRFDNQAGDYLLIGDHFANGEYQLGLQMLADIPSNRDLTDDELTDHQRITHIYQTIGADGFSALEEDFVDDLVSYADSKEGRSCIMARALLMNEGIYYDPITDIPIGAGENRLASIDANTKVVAFPNPAGNMVTFVYDHFVSNETSEVRVDIIDLWGRIVHTLTPSSDALQIEWQTDEVRSGMYIYNLKVDGKRVHTERLVISK